jgi:hypothetical protein
MNNFSTVFSACRKRTSSAVFGRLLSEPRLTPQEVANKPATATVATLRNLL